MYWTDDGLGYFEFLQVSADFHILYPSQVIVVATSVNDDDVVVVVVIVEQLAEDLGAIPIWVFNNGNFMFIFVNLHLFKSPLNKLPKITYYFHQNS